MSRRMLAASLVLTASVLAEPAAQQAPVFRSATQTVPMYVTVVDPNGHLLTDLTRDDFEILDNGRRQPVTLFDSGIQPISVVVMLDMSGSMTGNIPVLRSAAVQMFTRLLPADKARVGNFGDRITISPRFTNDQNELIRALYLDLQPGGPTPLWGAVNAAMSALSPVAGRRVVLVMSDGRDTSAMGFGMNRPGVTLKEVSQRAQTEEFMVYAIGMRSRGGPTGGSSAGSAGPAYGNPGGGGGTYGGYGSSSGRYRPSGGGGDEPDPGLRELALESGGGYFELVGTNDLGETFARVAEELHRQFLLGFAAPENDGRLHRVEVKVHVPGLTVRSRQSYVAPGK